MRRTTDLHDELMRQFLEMPTVHEKMPEPEYVVTWGCGVHVMMLPDGRVVEMDDHADNCEHEAGKAT